jgi:hypothetical protein
VGAGASCKACGISTTDPPKSAVLNQTCTEPSTDPNKCFACQDEHCCETISACDNSVECQSFKTCANACPDPGEECIKKCSEDHPEGASLMGPLLACGIYYCATDQVQCDRSKRDACVECKYGTCGDAYAALAATKTGYALELCIIACPIDHATCDQACYDRYPQARDAYLGYGECLLVACVDKC